MPTSRETSLGHDEHAGHSPEMFRRKFWGTLLLSLPTLIWSPMVQHWFRYEAFGGPWASRWVPAIFGTLVFAYGGSVFIRGAIAEMRERLPGMMTLISLAIGVAFLFSLAVTFGFPGSDLWWELATLVTIMLLGHWIQQRSVTQAEGALNELAKLLPDTAVRLVGDQTQTVPISDLRDRDVVLIRPASAIAADGVVQDGSSDVNESLITGESRPVRKNVGDHVIAGSVNGSGSLRVVVTATGEKTALAGISSLPADHRRHRLRARDTRRLDCRRRAFVIERVISVLVIACPHALGLAISLVIAISTTLAARSGLIVRDRRGLEEARNVGAVFFDKTGTLTRGEFRVVEITTIGTLSHDSALAIAASVEHDSEHDRAGDREKR